MAVGGDVDASRAKPRSRSLAILMSALLVCNSAILSSAAARALADATVNLDLT